MQIATNTNISKEINKDASFKMSFWSSEKNLNWELSACNTNLIMFLKLFPHQMGTSKNECRNSRLHTTEGVEQ